MAPPHSPFAFARRKLDKLTVEDETSFRHVGLYGELKRVLRTSGYSFRVLPPDAATWNRALFLNLTFWAAEEGGDVLVDETVPADVVAHVAWHHLAARALPTGKGERPSAAALFLGESIASAFDLYLVGRLLGHAPKSTFLATQVPAMADVADSAGLAEDDFDAMLQEVARDPEGAFASLRALLFDAASALLPCATAEEAMAALAAFDAHRFGSLLHHYELANWVLYARAYGSGAPAPEVDEVVRCIESAKDPLAWLTTAWVRPALSVT